jgi:hypothetical protein
MPKRWRLAVFAVVLAASCCSTTTAVASSGGGTGQGDWPMFGYNTQRTNVGPSNTGIDGANLHRLTRRVVAIDGTVDSSPVQLHAVRVGGRVRDVVFVTTTYGKVIALDPGTGAKLWEYVPPDLAEYQGSYRITTASPIIDPDRRYLYASSPDGLIRKLAIATGQVIWASAVTLRPDREKISSALNIDGSSLVVTTSGYFDTPPYDGHVVLIDRASGRVTRVWNALCSNIHRLILPTACPESSNPLGAASIWGRAGAVVEPGNGRILVTTANGPFNGATDWGQSVLEFSQGLKLLHNWTPRNLAQLNATDLDQGSTSPALLPKVGGRRLVVQGGKAGVLSLLSLPKLDGTSGPAGPRLGGELQDFRPPIHPPTVGAPAIWRNDGRLYLFISDASHSGGYVLTGTRRPRLRFIWRGRPSATNPVVAGGLLFEYGYADSKLRILSPRSGRILITLPTTGLGHWNSPIIEDGRIVLPVGSANDHLATGTIDIFHLPGR